MCCMCGVMFVDKMVTGMSQTVLRVMGICLHMFIVYKVSEIYMMNCGVVGNFADLLCTPMGDSIGKCAASTRRELDHRPLASRRGGRPAPCKGW
jgi:hypothetical protein